MKILPQLTQRQCKQFTIQDMSERLDLEITYTKSMLQILLEKNLIRKEQHYSCPQCHSQNVFVCDGFDSSYQCYQCKAIIEPARVETEGRPFYSVSKDSFMQYVKDKYPDIFHMTSDSKKEIIPFRPTVVEPSEEKDVSTKDKTERVDTNVTEVVETFDDRITGLENDKKEKKLFWAIVKIIALFAFMGSATGFVLYELVAIFVFKEQHAFLYEMFMRAMKESVIQTDDLGGVFIGFIGTILTIIVGTIDVFGWKSVKKCYNKIKKELVG